MSKKTIIKTIAKVLIIGVFVISVMTSVERTNAEDVDFDRVFYYSGAVMLIIDSETGEIENANEAAIEFYGYSKEELVHMNISQINTYSKEKIKQEMELATKEERNFFVFRHKLKSGEIRTVEVYSYPYQYQGKSYLLSTVHDITEASELEKKTNILRILIYILLTIFLCLAIMVVLLFRKNLEKTKRAKEVIENFFEQRKTFLDADNRYIYMKDSLLEYIFANKEMLRFLNTTEEQLIGKKSINNNPFFEMQNAIDKKILDTRESVVKDIEWNGNIYRSRKFPILLSDNQFGLGAYIEDVTDEVQIHKDKEKMIERNKVIFEIFSKNFDSIEEQTIFSLEGILRFLESCWGVLFIQSRDGKEEFYYFSDQKVEDKERTELFSRLKESEYFKTSLEKESGIYVMGEENQNSHIKENLIFLTVSSENQRKAVIILGKSKNSFFETDETNIKIMMKSLLVSRERRENLEHLFVERNRYFKTLISLTDGVMVIDMHGKIEIINKEAEKIFASKTEELKGQSYQMIYNVRSNDEILLPLYEKIVSNPKGVVQERKVLFTNRLGKMHILEETGAPIEGEKGELMGVVLVFRDITESQEQRKKIEYLSYHDALTGLYNRTYFEEIFHEYDKEENYPLCILSADVDGLKLTNDIFGHALGDTLLISTAELIQKALEKEEIVFRVGGDEFVILLPRTTEEEAENKIQKIKQSIAKKSITAIKTGVSIGYQVKRSKEENLEEVLQEAEAKMYDEKSMYKSSNGRQTVDSLIHRLHQMNEIEERHSVEVSHISEKIGRKIGLSEAELKLLREAAYLHDIGKIRIESRLEMEQDQVLEGAIQEGKEHPSIGYRIINSFEETMDIGEFVLSHHENWDGTGYPRGLKGEEIPLIARIISVADYYVKYKQIMEEKKGEADVILSEETVKQGVLALSGTFLDPDIVEAFLEV